MRDADELTQAAEIVPEKLYFVSLRRAEALSASPTARKSICFSIDNELIYEPFFADFGPLNLGQAYRFCEKTSAMLKEGAKTGQRVYYCCGSHPHQVSNAAVLAGIYQVMVLGRNADDAYQPLTQYKPFVPFRDASCGVSTFHLTVYDCIRGMQKARDAGFVNFTNNTFDVEEYQYYEQVEHGDLNWIVPGKFVAFSGPSSKHAEFHGYRSLVPEDYTDYYKHKGVTGVVRLNKKAYDRRRFTESGLHHYDLYFQDGSCPPENILKQFMEIAENEPGALAVHCKAGLGRTGVLICCFMMKHYKFTAEEAVGYIRVCRPGSVIGPQQHYLRDMQSRMWRDGDVYRQHRAMATHESSRSSSASSDRTSIRSDGREVDYKRTSPMKSLRTGTKPTNVAAITRQMAGSSISSPGYGSDQKPAIPLKADTGFDRFSGAMTGFALGGRGTCQEGGTGFQRSRSSAAATSTPVLLPMRRDAVSSSSGMPKSLGSVRHSSPTFSNAWPSMMGKRGVTSDQGRSASAADADARNHANPCHSGFQTTPQSKPTSVSRVLAPNGQPRKVPTAIAVNGSRQGGDYSSPTSPSLRYGVRNGFSSAFRSSPFGSREK